jgi:hypothetical protein
LAIGGQSHGLVQRELADLRPPLGIDHQDFVLVKHRNEQPRPGGSQSQSFVVQPAGIVQPSGHADALRLARRQLAVGREGGDHAFALSVGPGHKLTHRGIDSQQSKLPQVGVPTMMFAAGQHIQVFALPG